MRKENGYPIPDGNSDTSSDAGDDTSSDAGDDVGLSVDFERKSYPSEPRDSIDNFYPSDLNFLGLPDRFSDLLIDNQPLKQQLKRLIDLTVEEMKSAPDQEEIENCCRKFYRKLCAFLKRYGFAGLIIFVSLSSSYIYVKPAGEAVSDDGPGWYVVAILSAVLINVGINLYFNFGAVDSLRHSRCILTGELNRSKWVYGLGLLASFISAFAMASIGFKRTLSGIIQAALQLFNYTAQHYVGIIGMIVLVIKLCRYLRRHRASKAEIQAEMLKKALEASLFQRYQDFNKDKSKEVLFNRDALVELVLQKYPAESEFKQDSGCFNIECIVLNSLQFLGLILQLLGNVGYINTTVNALLESGLFTWEESVAIACVILAPFIGLSFVMSIDVINWVWDSLKLLFEARLKKRDSDKLINLDVLCDAIPFGMRRARWFSLVSGTCSLGLTGLSFFATMELYDQAVGYRNTDDNPPHLTFLDPSQRYRTVYYYLVVVATIFFNIRPLPQVLNAAAEKVLRYLTGTPADRAQIKVLTIIQNVLARAESIPAHAFSKVGDSKEGDIQLTILLTGQRKPQPRRPLCEQVTSYFKNLIWGNQEDPETFNNKTTPAVYQIN
jgi:uncharacterized membrane protein